jgi:hypothetical protein
MERHRSRSRTPPTFGESMAALREETARLRETSRATLGELEANTAFMRATVVLLRDMFQILHRLRVVPDSILPSPDEPLREPEPHVVVEPPSPSASVDYSAD